MAYINLLPWRQELREEKKNIFLISLGIAGAIAALIIGIVYLVYMQKIGYQNEINDFLSQKIQEANRKAKVVQNIKKERLRLVDQIRVIQNLQSERPKPVQLFDTVPRVSPQGLFLTEIRREANTLTLIGYAESNPRVSKLMRNLEETRLLLNPKTEFIRWNQDNPTALNKQFEMNATIY